MRFLKKSAGGLRRAALTTAFIVVATRAWAQQGVIDHSQGFTGQTDLTLNGKTSISGSNARLTDSGTSEASTFFFTNQVPVTTFETKFTFHQLAGSATLADGFCFILQGASVTALGPSGGGMAYGPDSITVTPLPASAITKSVCVKFDLYSNDGEGVNSTGLFVDGNAPTVANNVTDQKLVTLAGSAIDLHSGHDFQAVLSYDGTTLTETITDLSTQGTFTTTYTVNIPSHITANSGWVGFGGGTGGLTAVQEIMSWAYGVGLAPTNLSATAGVDQASLSWTASPGAASYTVLRSTTSGGSPPGTYSPVASNVTSTTYVDTTATHGQTYFYVVIAVTGGQNSIYSNEASCTPLPAVSVTPTTGLTVSESGTQASFTLTPNVPFTAAGSFTVAVQSTNSAQALVSWNGSSPAAGVTVTFSSQAVQTVTITGADDSIAGDPQTVTLDVGPIQTSSEPGYTIGYALPSVSVSVLEVDTPGILVSQISGPLVDGGTSVSFAVQLNSMPVSSTNPITAGTVVLDISNSAPQVCIVNQTQLTFGANWNTPQIVTITPLNDNGQNPAVFFSVQSVTVTLTPDPLSTDPVYAAMGPVSVTAPFVDPYQPPALPQVWNGSGGGGGCGLTGLEALVLIGMAAGWRRRRRNP